MDEIKTQYETNVFGLIRTTQAVLPIMRKQKNWNHDVEQWLGTKRNMSDEEFYKMMRRNLMM